MKNLFSLSFFIVLLLVGQELMAQKKVTLNYKNKSSAIDIPIDLEEDFYLELTGAPFNAELYTRENMIMEMRQVMRDFRKAQDLFFQGEYAPALISVNKSLATLETAEAFALKGTIFFFLDEIERAKSYWDRAVRLDPEIVVPSVEEAQKAFEQMQKNRKENPTAPDNSERKTSTQSGSNLPPRQ